MTTRRRFVNASLVAVAILALGGTTNPPLPVLPSPAVARAGSVVAHGHASAAPDHCVLLFYLKQEVHPDAAPGQDLQSLQNTWAQAHEWLRNSEVAEADITVRPPVSRQFSDQKSYLVQRVAIGRSLDAGVVTAPAKAEQFLERVARLIDQAANRGLYPAAQLSQLVTDAYDVNDSSSTGVDLTNHFVLYFPSRPDDLTAAALKDAAGSLREHIEFLARIDATGPSSPPRGARIRDLSSDEESTSQSTDLQAGRIGMASPNLAEVHALTTLTADIDLLPPAADKEQKPAAPKPDDNAQTITVTATGRVPAPADQAFLLTRLVAPDASYQKALSRLADLHKQVADKVRAANDAAVGGPTLDSQGVAFFCGYPGANNFGMIGMNANAGGESPSGAYRDVRITFLRRPSEDQAAFRRRVEKFAASLSPADANPAVNPNNPNVPPPEPADRTHEILYYPNDPVTYRTQALRKALADARASAARTLSAMNGRLIDLAEIDLSDDPSALSPADPAFALQQPTQPQTYHPTDPSEITITLTLRFHAEIP